jgi:hypothetical protein
MATRPHVLSAHPATGTRSAPRGATPQVPSLVSSAATALVIAILALIRPAPLAWAIQFSQAPAPPAPRIYAYPALYRYQHTRWQRTAVLRPGDVARFTLLFRLAAPGWQFPSAVLQVWRLSPRGMEYGPALDTLPLRRERWSQGFTRFSGALRIGTNRTGPFDATFGVSNGRGAQAGVSLRFTITR